MVGKHDQHLRFQGLKFEPAAMQLTNFGQRRLLVHQNWKPQYGKQIESKLITMKIVRLNLCVFSGSLPSTLMAVMWFGISCLFRPIGPWMRSWRCLGCAREKQLSCARGWWWWWWWRRRRRRRWCLAPPHPPRLCVQPSRNLCVQVRRRPQSFQVRFPAVPPPAGKARNGLFTWDLELVNSVNSVNSTAVWFSLGSRHFEVKAQLNLCQSGICEALRIPTLSHNALQKHGAKPNIQGFTAVDHHTVKPC